MKIKEIPINDRPIERLKNNGVESLSNEELLAIILKNGTKNMSSKDLALLILSKISNINEIDELSLEELQTIKGIGLKKASTLLATIELGKRIQNKTDMVKTKVTSSEIIFNMYKNKIGSKKQEEFHCLFLDNSKNIITKKLIYIGTINYSVIHPREIFKEAVKSSSSSIICIHNHPSGNETPSKEDINMTNQIVNIGKMMGIPVIDHIIVTKNHYYSFFDNNLIKN